MVSSKLVGNRKSMGIFIIICAVIISPFTGSAFGEEKKAPAKPVTTGKPDISVEELKYRLHPLTKDDLSVEADAWLQLLKEHGQVLSRAQIAVLKAEESEKTKLLETVTRLEEKKIVLIDRLKAVVEEYRLKGAKVEEYEAYEAYIDTVSGVDVKISDFNATLAVISGWLTSAQGGLRWLKNISFFLVIVLASWILSVLLGKAVKKAVVKINNASELLKDFIVNITRKLIFIIGFVVAISMLEVNVGPLLAAIGAAGFIIGFALQGTLSNFAAGILILIYRPYDVGDLIEVGGAGGTVDAMTIVSTTLLTLDNQKVVVPNNMIWGDKITNLTGSDKRRVDMVFGIGYGDDIAKAQTILEEIVASHESVLKDPEPVVKVHELADSSVNFVVRPWVETDDYWDVYWDVTRKVYAPFSAQRVSIPFPQQDVHMHQVAAT